MTRSSVGLIAAAVALFACEGREVSVFEVPAMVGGSTQAGSAAGNAPSGGVGGTGAGGAGPSAGSQQLPSAGNDGGTAAGAPPIGFAGSGGGPGMPMPMPCASLDDCQPGWVCNKIGCDPTLLGQCVPWPTFCDAAPKPVCGCDGVTYWNDCIRLQASAPTALSSPGQCQATACTCEVGSDCNVPYASCSHLLPPGEMCGHGMGACWVLPSQCDPAADPKRWRECKPPPDGVAPQCVDTCTAIATEHSYAELHRGETCN
jgi:hypothetical protein